MANPQISKQAVAHRLNKIHNLASEAKQKLKQIRPTSIGQALRISGVNPADISLIMVYIKKEYFYESK